MADTQGLKFKCWQVKVDMHQLEALLSTYTQEGWKIVSVSHQDNFVHTIGPNRGQPTGDISVLITMSRSQ